LGPIRWKGYFESHHLWNSNNYSRGVLTIGGALIIGIPVGLIAGYYEGWLGAVLMRLCDVFLALPQIILALALASALGANIRNAVIALTITYWPWWSRVVYAETLSVKRSTFVEASLALGREDSVL
jgi:peptide/nickel transport system permease protein